MVAQNHSYFLGREDPAGEAIDYSVGTHLASNSFILIILGCLKARVKSPLHSHPLFPSSFPPPSSSSSRNDTFAFSRLMILLIKVMKDPRGLQLLPVFLASIQRPCMLSAHLLHWGQAARLTRRQLLQLRSRQNAGSLGCRAHAGHVPKEIDCNNETDGNIC